MNRSVWPLAAAKVVVSLCETVRSRSERSTVFASRTEIANWRSEELWGMGRD